jgi:hypothetical protein
MKVVAERGAGVRRRFEFACFGVGLRSLGGHPPEFRPDDLESAARMHARWSTCIASDAREATRLLEWAATPSPTCPRSPARSRNLSCRLDLLEANELAARFGLRR